MKTLIKIFLLVFIILASFLFYQKYLSKKSDENRLYESIELNNQITTKDVLPDNNLIKNLNYEIILNNRSKYLINSELSEVTYKEDFENVKMTNVEAIITNKENALTIINSDIANYESISHNTIFENNVQIKYLDYIIQCDKIFLNFIDQSIIIEDNIKYNNGLEYISADLVKINLLTKKIEIFMKNKNNKIQVYKKN
jgi:lipopolysaccharide assembly outer membrane protein LptD (OstA)